MINFPGDSTIPGFPSIDAFLALLNPLLKKLQTPAYEINNKIHEIMEIEVTTIIGDVLSPKYPEFNSRFKDLIKRILDKVPYHLYSIEEVSRPTWTLCLTVNYFTCIQMISTILSEISESPYLFNY